MRIILSLLFAASSLSAAPRWTAWDTIQHLFPGFQILQGIFADTHQSGGGGNTFTFIQQWGWGGEGFCNVAACSLDVSAISLGSGHLIVLQTDAGGGSTVITSVTDNGSGGSSTWAVPVGCTITSGGAGGSVAYTLSSKASITTLTVNNNGLNSMRVFLTESSLSPGPALFDVCAKGTPSNSGTSVAGQALTLTGASDLIIQSEAGLTASAISSPYSHFQQAFGTNSATSYNTSSGSAPTWTITGTGSTLETAAAFK